MERQLFSPSEAFKKQANCSSAALYEEAKIDRDVFWGKQAECLTWSKPWEKLLNWTPPYSQWYIGGKLNACYNCVDRHLADKRNKAAIIWEGEGGENRTLTYWDLYREVNLFANVLKSFEVKKGDIVAIYLPMIPEAIIAMLACARIGAVHSVVFGGFSAESLKDRLLDAQAKVLITADGSKRRGILLRLKDVVDKIIDRCPTVKSVLVIKHSYSDVIMQDGRDYWYDQCSQNVPSLCSPEEMDAEDPLFILYTSGTTGKPKGILHTTGGYMVGVTTTTKWVFDIKENDVYWCTADIGWITGHSYVVYGVLSNGGSELIYEGAYDWPKPNRYWKLIEKYGVTILYTAPTAIRTFMKHGEESLQGCDLSSLRLLGSVGEPINPEAWLWYYTHIGQKKCPIVDTWWQTETGSILIAPLPGITTLKPGSATHPLPGIETAIVNEKGEASSKGLLVVTKPWPSMLRGIYNDSERFEKTYWKKLENFYFFTGDGAFLDNEGYYWLLGRVDDIINVSGHRIGTMEIESALASHPNVAEAAVIGMKDVIKGQAICAFVILKASTHSSKTSEDELRSHVGEKIGSFAKPQKIIFTCDIPKTRSGKIMRRLLRDICEGAILGDISTLADSGIIHELKAKYENDSKYREDV